MSEPLTRPDGTDTEGRRCKTDECGRAADPGDRRLNLPARPWCCAPCGIGWSRFPTVPPGRHFATCDERHRSERTGAEG